MTRICSRCVLPEAPPGIVFNEEGLCNLCVEHEQIRQEQGEARPLETDFIKLINKQKGKGAYDCMVMCSGGKDSISALYYMVKRYRMKTLAFTFDHGFEVSEALGNVENAVAKLGVDFMLFRSSHMHEMFKRILHSGSRAVLCHPCSIWYMELAYDIAARFQIPIIVAGWTKGQSIKQATNSKVGCDAAPEFTAMSRATQEFLDEGLEDLPQYKNFPRSMEEVTKRARKKHKSIVVSPHWFLPYDHHEYVELIRKELGWKPPKRSYPKGSTNCDLNFLSAHLSMKNFGYTHYHIEASKLIRTGVLTREEALASLEIDFGPELLNEIAAKLDHVLE